MLSQVNSEGSKFKLLKQLYDHRLYWHAIQKRFGVTVSKNGNKNPKRTAVGCKIQVKWKGGSMQLLDLKVLKAL